MDRDIQKAIDSAIRDHETRVNRAGWLIIFCLCVVGELYRRVMGFNGWDMFVDRLETIGNYGRWLW